jgi:hypothetical protein
MRAGGGTLWWGSFPLSPAGHSKVSQCMSSLILGRGVNGRPSHRTHAGRESPTGDTLARIGEIPSFVYTYPLLPLVVLLEYILEGCVSWHPRLPLLAEIVLPARLLPLCPQVFTCIDVHACRSALSLSRNRPL